MLWGWRALRWSWCPVAQAMKLVVHEFPLHPLAQRKERRWMRFHHIKLPFTGYFLSPSSIDLGKSMVATGSRRELTEIPKGKDLWGYDILFSADVCSFFLRPIGIISLSTLISISVNRENSVNCASAKELQGWEFSKLWGIMIQG